MKWRRVCIAIKKTDGRDEQSWESLPGFGYSAATCPMLRSLLLNIGGKLQKSDTRRGAMKMLSSKVQNQPNHLPYAEVVLADIQD